MYQHDVYPRYNTELTLKSTFIVHRIGVIIVSPDITKYYIIRQYKDQTRIMIYI